MDPIVADAVKGLTRATYPLNEAKHDLPRGGGLYAWWAERTALPDVPGVTHPSEADRMLVYIGIAPSGATSTATLRSRVVGNHMGGNLAASTLRRTLAALLRERLLLEPRKTATKVVLSPEQNKLLSDWQQQHLRLTWHEFVTPWTIEGAVIAALKPPFNLAQNRMHAFYPVLSAARTAFVAMAK